MPQPHTTHQRSQRAFPPPAIALAALLSTGLITGCADDLQAPSDDAQTPELPAVELPGPGGDAVSFVANGAFYSAAVDATHRKFIDGIKSLFEDHKAR